MPKLIDTTKAVLTGRIMAIIAYLKSHQTVEKLNNKSMCHKALEK